MVMDRFDFTPLFRSTIGFDRLTRLVDAATRVDSASLAYPPYNIEKTGSHIAKGSQRYDISVYTPSRPSRELWTECYTVGTLPIDPDSLD
jgi:HSP20 family molecular chaperone IbpA